MIIKCDAAQLEWRTKVFLSQDPIAMEEILENKDLHSDNQKTFGLPSRLIAKIFLFRLIFADAFGPNGNSGPAYAYSQDNDFKGTSTSTKYWENVIEKFFEKYDGIKQHSLDLIREATTTGRVTSPCGMFWPFSPVMKYNGEMDWPRTTILNYPIQGLSAKLMEGARWEIRKKLIGEWATKYPKKVLLINTVHDDVEVDVDTDPEIVYNICIDLINAFRSMPTVFEKRYGIKWNVPMDGETKFGWNLAEKGMIKFNPKTFEEDYKNAVSSRTD